MSAEGNLPPARPRSRGGAAIAALIVVFVAATIAFAGGWMLGARRTVLAVASPGGDAVAYVFEARCARRREQHPRVAIHDVRQIVAERGPWNPFGLVFMKHRLPVPGQIDLRDCSARACPIADLTCFFSSGGGSTAFMPRPWRDSSRSQPFE